MATDESAIPSGQDGREHDELASLKAERKKLVAAEINAYSPEHFPGSRGWLVNQGARNALAAFDREHPEVFSAVMAEAAASLPEYVARPDSFYNRALRGED